MKAIYRWNILRRKFRNHIWLPSLPRSTKRTLLVLRSCLGIPSHEGEVRPDQVPIVQPNRGTDDFVVSIALGMMCRLRWPRMQTDLNFHYMTSPGHFTPPREIFVTFNTRSVNRWIPEFAQLRIGADGVSEFFEGQSFGIFNRGDQRLTCVFALEPDRLGELVSARELEFDLEGLCIPIGPNAKCAVKNLLSFKPAGIDPV